MQIKLRQVGNSIGATFPKEVLDKFGLKSGDELNLIVTSEGIQLIPFEPNFAETLSAYKEGAAKYRNAMRELAVLKDLSTELSGTSRIVGDTAPHNG